jgi:antitoxin component of MazEF toxin-antitoxin module
MESIHITKLVRVGDSLGVITPKTILKAYNWKRGDILVFTFINNDTLAIRRLTDVEIRAIKEKTAVIDFETRREINNHEK